MQSQTEYKGYAQVEAEKAMANLITLNAWAMDRVNRGKNITSSEGYPRLRELYYEVLLIVLDLVSLTREQQILPEDSHRVPFHIANFIRRVKTEGRMYHVGKPLLDL